MAYQVTIHTKRDGKAGGPFRAIDLTKSQLEDEIVDLYRLGGSISSFDRTIDPDEIVRIRILETNGRWADWSREHMFSLGNDGWDRFLSESDARDVTLIYIDGPPGAAGPSSSSRESSDRRRVMVVYGRNERARSAMFSFLLALGLRPIAWEDAISETGHASPHNLDAVRAAMAAAQAVVVLFTGEDEARLVEALAASDDERDLVPQPRPNVLLEAGMALGTNPLRTILTQLGPLRSASDLAGLNYVKLSNSTEARSDLKRRLKGAGCDIADEPGPDWMSPASGGDFDAAVIREASTESQRAARQLGAGLLTPSVANKIQRFLRLRASIDQPFTANDLATDLGIDPEFADRLLVNLEGEGRVESVGEGAWYPTSPVD